MAGMQRTMYPSLDSLNQSEGSAPDFTDTVEQQPNGQPQKSSIPTPVLWPTDGDNIRFHATLSRRRDGCLRIKRKAVSYFDSNTLVVDTHGRIDSDNALFRFYRTRSRSDITDNISAWLGIPGERLGKDSSKVYMLKSSEHNGKKTLVAKGYRKDPTRDVKYPPIVSAEEAISLEFTLEYDGNGIFRIRDNELWRSSPPEFYYLRSNGDGVIERVKRNSRLRQQAFNNPGMMFHMMHLGNDAALREGD
ncbi:uncharacterized protein LOC144442822 [Glandiceps talaboti]